MSDRKTWFLDFDGTLVYQRSHLLETDRILPGTEEFFKNTVLETDYVVITTGREAEHHDRIRSFMELHGLKCDLIVCGLPTGPRIVVNDRKPCGMVTALAISVTRDAGIQTQREEQ